MVTLLQWHSEGVQSWPPCPGILPLKLHMGTTWGGYRLSTAGVPLEWIWLTRFGGLPGHLYIFLSFQVTISGSQDWELFCFPRVTDFLEVANSPTHPPQQTSEGLSMTWYLYKEMLLWAMPLPPDEPAWKLLYLPFLFPQINTRWQTTHRESY